MSDKQFFSTDEVDGVLVVRALTNRVRTDEADQLAQQLLGEGAPEGPVRVCINLGGVEFVDSGALAVLWRINENTNARFCHISELVKGTFKILGILNVLLVHDTEAQALKAFSDHAR